MFKGSQKFAQGVFDKAIESSGGATNAYTTSDLTVYHNELPTSELEKIIEMEADRMQNILLEKESFEIY